MDGIDTHIISLFNVFNCQVFINQLYTVLEYAMQSDCVLKKNKLFIYIFCTIVIVENVYICGC